MNGKRGCFGWDVAMCRCSILSETICKKQEYCPFFKTPKEVEESNERTKRRLLAIESGELTPYRPSGLPTPAPTPKRDRSDYNAARTEKLRSEGKCVICGKLTDRPNRYCCSACYQRKMAQRKAREKFLYGY